MTDRVMGRRVTVPMFDISSNPSISLSAIKNRHFISTICPICGARVFDLLAHAKEVEDHLHGWLIIMES